MVSYFNAIPFYVSLTNEFKENEIEILTLPPSQCGEAYKNNECDLALLPIGALLELESPIRILNSFCIGANKKVDSVFLFAQKPIEEIETVLLDTHSMTSNGLAKILFKYKWSRDVLYIKKEKHWEQIQDQVAGVVIGDLAMDIKDKFRYKYDLAFEWYQWKTLKFPFAVWVMHPTITDPALLTRVKAGITIHENQLDSIAYQYSSQYGYTVKDGYEYLINSLDYHFCDSKKISLGQYLMLLSEVNGQEWEDKILYV